MAIQASFFRGHCWDAPSPPQDGGNAGNGGKPGQAGIGADGGRVVFAGSEEFLVASRDFVVTNFGGSNGTNGLPGRSGIPGQGGRGGHASPYCGGSFFPDAKNGTQGLLAEPLNPLEHESKPGNIEEVEVHLT